MPPGGVARVMARQRAAPTRRRGVEETRVSDWIAQITRSAEIFCKSTSDDTSYASCFAGKGDTTYLQWLLQAWGWTLLVALVALAIALVIGLAVGVMRTLPNKAVAFFGEAWTELFRNIPIVVQLLIWYRVVPELVPVLKGVPEAVLACIGLGLFTSARISQQIKAGINTLPQGQRYAGLAMGLTLGQTYRYVILPVALRVVLPTLTSESMNIIKNSSVASAIGVTELIFFSTQAGEETSMHGTMYFAATVLYFVSAFTINRLAVVAERRSRLPGALGSAR
jgi:glutamate/aspartate transport system permease protein